MSKTSGFKSPFNTYRFVVTLFQQKTLDYPVPEIGEVLQPFVTCLASCLRLDLLE